MWSARKKAPPLDWRSTYQQLAESIPDSPLRRFYAAGSVSMDQPLSQTPFVSLDLETTGLDADQDAIVSAGLLPMTVDSIHCAGSRYWMINPDSPLSSESVTIHELTHTDLSQAPRIEQCLDEILAALAQKVVVVHCVSIERNFLLQASLKVYGHPLYFPVVDTMGIEAGVVRSNWLKRFAGKRESLRLDACRQRYHLPRYKAHHALTDALASAELLQAQIAHHMDPEQPISDIWI